MATLRVTRMKPETVEYEILAGCVKILPVELPGHSDEHPAAYDRWIKIDELCQIVDAYRAQQTGQHVASHPFTIPNGTAQGGGTIPMGGQHIMPDAIERTRIFQHAQSKLNHD